LLQDNEQIRFYDKGQRWTISWHPQEPKDGTRHGSAAICFDANHEVVLVSIDHGVTWNLPGGRPEEDESYLDTLNREVLEEACATVRNAILLGYSRGECVWGPEHGLVLVRSCWAATVDLLPFKPQHETTDRRLTHNNVVLEELTFPYGMRPIYERWIHDAIAFSSN